MDNKTAKNVLCDYVFFDYDMMQIADKYIDKSIEEPLAKTLHARALVTEAMRKACAALSKLEPVSVRFVILSGGNVMGAELVIFKTDAPKERLQALEKECSDLYANGANDYDVPLWTEILADEGYSFEPVASHEMETSKEWLEENYPKVNERYIIIK